MLKGKDYQNSFIDKPYEKEAKDGENSPP